MNSIRYVTEQILDYMISNNTILIQNFGDSCLLLHRIWSGSHINPYTIVTYDDDPTNLVFTVWVGNPGGTPNLNHPDLRYDTGPDQRGTFKVVKDGTELNRQRYVTDLALDTDFYVGSDDEGTVTVTLYSAAITYVTVEYDVLCYCADPERSTARANCTTCYGTMYEGGFVLDSGSAGPYNASGTILVRIPPNYKDIVVENVRNLRVDESAEAWTLAPPVYPQIDDYDILIPCTGNHSGSLFEVTTVKISHLRDRQLSQRMTIKNPEDTHILMQHPIFIGWNIFVDISGVGKGSVAVTCSGKDSQTTDASGSCQFSLVPNGAKTLTYSYNGYEYSPSHSDITVYNSDTNILVSSSVVTVSGTITGVGKANATVTLSSFGSTTTDSNGEYSFSTVLDGTYTLTISKDGYIYSPNTQSITVNRESVVVDPIVSVPVVIMGTITGVGKENALVTLGSFGSTTTDADGNYLFTTVLDDTYTLTISLDGYIYSPDIQSITVNRESVVVDPIVSVSVVVSGSISGTGKEGVLVTLSSFGSTTTDSNGDYLFTTVLDDTYTLTAIKDGYQFTNNGQSVVVNRDSVTPTTMVISEVALSGYIVL